MIEEGAMPYQFHRSARLSPAGDQRILDRYPPHQTTGNLPPAWKTAWFRGALFQLFGPPTEGSLNDEEYTYVITATAPDGTTLPLMVYEGGSGPAIQGPPTPAGRAASHALIAQIDATTPANFMMTMESSEYGTTVHLGCRDGICYYEEFHGDPPTVDMLLPRAIARIPQAAIFQIHATLMQAGWSLYQLRSDDPRPTRSISLTPLVRATVQSFLDGSVLQDYDAVLVCLSVLMDGVILARPTLLALFPKLTTLSNEHVVVFGARAQADGQWAIALHDYVVLLPGFALETKERPAGALSPSITVPAINC
jgi:hypothetical protein